MDINELIYAIYFIGGVLAGVLAASMWFVMP